MRLLQKVIGCPAAAIAALYILFPVLPRDASAAPQIRHDITVIQAEGGKITPAGGKTGRIRVVNGRKTTFTIKPARGNYMSVFLIDGAAVTTATDQNLTQVGTSSRYKYVFPSVTGPHTISATFAKKITWYKPAADTTWQWQLLGTVNTEYGADMYDIDLFDTPVSTISELKAAGKKVICYFSAGSWEDWRPDADSFRQSDLGNELDGWPDERWVDVRSADIRQIIRTRLDLAVQKGCDGVEPDNVDGYLNDPGFGFTAGDQLDFNIFLATEAHGRNLSVGLKNDLQQIKALVEHFDFSVNEQCHEFDECDDLMLFVNEGKPVFNAEYEATMVNDPAVRQSVCEDSLSRNFRTLILPLDLDDSFRFSCDP